MGGGSRLEMRVKVKVEMFSLVSYVFGKGRYVGLDLGGKIGESEKGGGGGGGGVVGQMELKTRCCRSGNCRP